MLRQDRRRTVALSGNIWNLPYWRSGMVLLLGITLRPLHHSLRNVKIAIDDLKLHLDTRANASTDINSVKLYEFVSPAHWKLF
jgi:hypothetical protein